MARKGKRIPKTIGGVKIPKDLRKAGEKLIDQAQKPETQAKIAGVLTMAAGAVAAAAAKKRAAAPPQPHSQPRPASPDPDRAGARPTPDAQVVADAIGQAAEQVLSRFFRRN